MKMIKSMFVALGLGLMAAPAAVAQPAQSASVIVMDYERVLATSVAGRDVEAKLRQIAEQMQTELRPEQQAVQQENQALQTAMQGRSPEQLQRDSSLQTRIAAFRTRAEALQAQQVSKGRDLEYSRQQALLEFNRALEPIVREVMTARRAGVVLDRQATQLVSDGIDVTADVVARLDQRTRTINVSRLTAPAPQQPPGGGQR